MSQKRIQPGGEQCQIPLHDSVPALSTELQRLLRDGEFSEKVRAEVLAYLPALRFASQSHVDLYPTALESQGELRTAIQVNPPKAQIGSTTDAMMVQAALMGSLIAHSGHVVQGVMHGGEKPPAETVETLRQKVRFVKSLEGK